LNILSKLSTNQRPWLILALSAFSLELCALFFQYAMDLKPCIMCVYQRAAIWAIFFAGVVGYFGYNFIIGRIVAYILWGTGAIWGLIIALEHVEIQSSTLSFLYSCELVPNFPIWAPLHEWIPFLFEATGDCGDINWQFFGYTMPQWMIVVYGAYTVLLAVIVLARLIGAKKL